MSVRISCFLVLAILGLAGCAENAILELEVDMPASTSDEPQYLVLLDELKHWLLHLFH